MGLIGVSDKGYPILAIPKKNTIKFSPAKIKANPLSKLEYERIQWEGIKKEKESKKDKKEAKRGKSVSSVVNQEQELPSNVIRIETLDESEEFIEIILPPTLEIDDPPLIDASAMFIPALRGVGSVIKGIKDTIKGAKFARSLTRQEVLGIIEKLEKGTSEHVRLVKDKKEFDELWKRLTKNATKIKERQVPITSKKTGQTTQETLTRYQLDDKTEIVYRTGSGSGGETINVYGKNPAINKTIHIKE